jgi:hypothetical protein
MMIKKTCRHASLIAAISLIGLLSLSSARADKGVIAANNSKCFVIGTPSGFVLVDGWVNAPQGTAVIGNFNTYGSTKIFDTNGNDVSGYIYIEEWGLSKSRLLEKWADKCAL